jgi:hypothetical protein
MGAYHEVANALILRQGDGQRWILFALFPAALKTQAHRIGMGYPAGQCLTDGRLQLQRPVAIEPTQECGGDGAEVVATLGRLGRAIA